ncbi:hypothetical protein [Aquimarina litoralis]|uniref:hypothetical protein n=1 Tax=Aquimarina litoralis TaxID=584605 RepID=UPI001C59084C|nr:hypothetical protein [Aquimarina litoralis]MBW1295906.1 hypothetical protein [Aquimarina litoralis]
MKTLTKISAIYLFTLLCSCSSDNDDNQSINNTPPTLTKEQLSGTWIISYFENQIDKTSDYEGFRFLFNAIDDVEAEVEDFNIDGKYDLFSDEINGQTYTIVDISFREDSSSAIVNNLLIDLIEEWIVTAITDDGTTIKFEERISNNPPEILHLTKL